MGLKNKTVLCLVTLALPMIFLAGCKNDVTTSNDDGEELSAQISMNQVTDLPNEEDEEPIVVVDPYPKVNCDADLRIFEADENGYVIGQKVIIGDHPIDTIIEEESSPMMNNFYYSDNYQDCMRESASNLDYVKSDIEKTVFLLNDRYFDDIFRPDNYSLEELYEIIESNSNIPGDIAEFVEQFVAEMMENFPDLDLRIFAYNLERVKFVYLEKEQIVEFSGEENGAAYYRREPNIVALPKTLDLNYLNNQLLLRHEIGHMLSNFTMKWDMYSLCYSFTPPGNDDIVEEGLNELLVNSTVHERIYKPLSEAGYGSLIPYMYRLTQDVEYAHSKMIGSNLYEFCDYLDLATEVGAPKAYPTLSDAEAIVQYRRYMVDFRKKEIETDSAQKSNDELWDQADSDLKGRLRPLYEYCAWVYKNRIGYSGMTQSEKDEVFQSYMDYFTREDYMMCHVAENFW